MTSSLFLDHPQGGTFSGLLYRVHPTKGLQYWSPLGACWKPDIYPLAPTGGSPLLSFEDTWAEPERDA